MASFAEIQTANTFIDKNLIKNELGVEEDDIDAAIGNSVKLCLESFKNSSSILEMKAE